MRIHMFILPLLLSSAGAIAEASPTIVTLEETISLVKQHPTLRIAELNNDAAKANLSGQASYAYNPELSVELQDRKLNDGGRSKDYYVGLSQGIELGGKGKYREQVAQASLDMSLAKQTLLHQQLISGAVTALVNLKQKQQILVVRQQQSELLQSLAEAVQKRLDVGDANLLDVNLATAAYVSAQSVYIQSQQDYTLALRQYYQAVGQFSMGEVQPKLPALNLTWQPPKQAYAVALAARQELKLLKLQSKQNDAQANLADASRLVDPTVSLMSGREAGEQLFKLGISIPLPLTNTNKGAYQASLAQAEQSQSQVLWFEKTLKLEVSAALQNHDNTMMILRQFTAAPIENNSMALAKQAFDAGELSLEGLVQHVNQALDAKLTHLQLLKQGWLARIQLAQTLGHPEYILQGIQK